MSLAKPALLSVVLLVQSSAPYVGRWQMNTEQCNLLAPNPQIIELQQDRLLSDDSVCLFDYIMPTDATRWTIGTRCYRNKQTLYPEHYNFEMYMNQDRLYISRGPAQTFGLARCP
jgi:hypothetical protein